MELGNYKIKVATEEESEEAQELFFALGYGWHRCGKQYNNIGDNKFIVAYPDEMTLRMGFGGGIKKETTLPQLRDLVVLHRNDVSDANAIDPDHVYSKLYLCCDNTLYVFVANTGKWKLSNKSGVPVVLNRLVKTQNNQELDSALIIGADALRALADGKEVEYLYGDKWLSVVGEQVLITAITNDKFKFRLKPSTITLNIEIPAPFEPTEDEEFYVLSSVQPSGYIKTHLKKHAFLGSWKSEHDIQQVVSALRGALKNG